MAAAAGLALRDEKGLRYNPITKTDALNGRPTPLSCAGNSATLPHPR
ncbi:hypothetical protein [Roseateles sp.]